MSDYPFLVGSLFAGIGGFDAGFERAGMKTWWQVEIDPFRRKVLSTHFPEALLYHDVRVVGDELDPVDLICGGFPCQDLSLAGLRKGLAGARSGLFSEIVRLLRLQQPRWFVLENVAALLSSKGGRDFGVVLQALAESGYGVGWRVLNSRFFGVAQQRRRVFIVGHLGGPCPFEVLFEPEDGRDVAVVRREARQRIRPRVRGSLEDPVGVANAICKSPSIKLDESFVIQNGVRRLTIIERERLQGFPDDWTRVEFKGRFASDTLRHMAIGDAVTLPVAEWLGRRIMSYEASS